MPMMIKNKQTAASYLEHPFCPSLQCIPMLRIAYYIMVSEFKTIHVQFIVSIMYLIVYLKSWYSMTT